MATSAELVQNAKVRFNHAESRLYLIEKYKTKLMVIQSGGMFNVTPELIGFLQSSTDESVILVDAYANPVKVDRQKLLTEAKEKYDQVMSQWLDEYTKLATEK
jgi:hypothetical protein